MTQPRAKIEASLAERGRPANWANENEAAVLSGYSLESFRSATADLEAAGFPQINRWNRKRYIPAILNFWAAQVDSAPIKKTESEPDGQEVENFHGNQRQSA